MQTTYNLAFVNAFDGRVLVASHLNPLDSTDYVAICLAAFAQGYVLISRFKE